MRLVESMPDLSLELVRHSALRRAELALADGDPELAAKLAERLLARLGADDAGKLPVAVLLTRCTAATGDPERREQLAQSAVTCLRLALQQHEATRDTLSDEDFAVLRGRADFDALRRR
jgi:hypothetical protein